MRTVAVLPVKTFARAKQRIADAVEGEHRRELAEAMVADVLAALGQADGVEGVVVVTAEPRAQVLAREAGATVVLDAREDGQSGAVRTGIDVALAGGAERVLCVPGDCPALQPTEVEELLGAHPEAAVVIVPDRHGHGTNALRLAPPDVVRPSFGPGSFARHAARARAAGAVARIAQVPSLGLDVDTPDDLLALRAALDARPDGAPRTRTVLDRVVPALAH